MPSVVALDGEGGKCPPITGDAPLERARPGHAIARRSFEHPEVQGGYGWRFDDIPGVQIDYDTLSPRTGTSALAVEFLDRAVKFAGVHQALALAPGHYRFEAAARDGVSGTRPFEWRISCDGGVIATLPIARDDTWHLQSTAFEVPPDCRKQALVLAHTGRSMEERRLQGRLLVDDLGIFLGVTNR